MRKRQLSVRRFAPGDEADLLRIFQSAVHLVASAQYSAEQVDAWAPADMDLEAWTARVSALRPFVATLDGVPVGYADLQADGYIDHFFVSGNHPRQGIGRALMARIVEEAEQLGIAELYSHVSLSAQPFFAAAGFRIAELRCVTIRGVELQHALMRR